MRFSATEVAEATAGTLLGPDVSFDGASFDTRSLQPGQLFVPVVAERDGHDFIPAALAAGAAGYLTSAGRPTEAPSVAAIEVADTSAALLDLARWGVQRLGAPVVAITGSVGKTSTKDLAAAAIAAGKRVTANLRSFNNEQGLPVTVLDAPQNTEVLVLEMGMRGFGEIAKLCSVAPPHIGIVTAVAPAHTERVGGIEGVARAKAELVQALPTAGTAILNADDPRVRAMAGLTEATVLTFGEAPGADVRLTRVVLDRLARPTMALSTPWGDIDCHLAVSGRHMAANAAAALAAAGALGVDIAAAAAALEGATLSASRMQVHELPSGGLLIDDAYNANPTSMRAALEALSALPADRRIAVLGVMAELDDPAAGHAEIAALVNELGIELVAVGTDRYGMEPVADAVAAVGSIGPGTAVVVKASLAGGLQKVAAALLESAGSQPLSR